MSTAPGTRSADPVGQLRRRWPVLLAIIVMWIALWGDVSVANVLGGALVGAAVLVLARSVKPRPVRHFSFGPAVRYLGTFARQLVVANWQVIKAVVRPDTIHPGILAMPLSHASDAVVTLVANSITLTPGTLTLETDRRGDVAILYVHTLDLSDEAGVREDISQLEKLAVDAFAGPDAQAVQAQTLSDLGEGHGPASAEVHPADTGRGDHSGGQAADGGADAARPGDASGQRHAADGGDDADGHEGRRGEEEST